VKYHFGQVSFQDTLSQVGITLEVVEKASLIPHRWSFSDRKAFVTPKTWRRNGPDLRLQATLYPPYSRWDCTLETTRNPKRFAVRLGRRMVHGLANADGGLIPIMRAEQP
jgi:hypothetical protein